MQTLKQQIGQVVETVFCEQFPGINTSIQVEYCDLVFGHFATNIALASAKTIGLKPIDIANTMATALAERPEFTSVEVQQPGFVNMRLQDAFLEENVQSIYQDPLQATRNLGKNRRMIIDYSHPNIGKPMGVHHLLSTIIGDSIKLLYRASGYEVIADNFIGDMGTQFGKLIHAVKTWGNMDAIEKDPINELLKLYVHFHIEADTDTTLDDAGRAEYKKLEEGDSENRALLEKIQKWSMAEITSLYDQLGVEFDYFNGESFYEDKIQAIIDLGKSKGIFVESQGALICKLDNPDEPPAIIQKSDGTSLYLTRDLARIAYWEKTWQPDYMVNVVDVAQSLQLRQLFEVSDKLGLTDADNVHVPFGRMQFSDGGMSTRKGNIILVQEVLAEVRKRAKAQVESVAKKLSQAEQAELVETLAINAVKYTIIRQNRISNLTFDWDNLLTLEGNSAPYLAYSLVRMQAIHRDSELLQTSQLPSSEQLDDAEIGLLLQLTRFPEVVEASLVHFQPSDVANYCYEICRMYNGFYHTHKILEGEQTKTSRVLINNATLRVVQACFTVLGLQQPKKM